MSNREISEIVGVCAGAVSVCWSDIDKAGEFDSSQASKFVDDALAEIQAAGYLKPRVITTAEGLDALGRLSSILDTNGAVWVNDGESEDPWASLAESPLGGPIWTDSSYIALPVTVLHDPSVTP